MRLRSLVAVFAALMLVGGLASCTKKDSGDEGGTGLEDLALGGSDCGEALRLYGSMLGAAGTLMAGATDEQVQKLEDDIEKLKDSVPSDLQDDFQTVADAYQQFSEVFAGASVEDYLDPEFQDEMQEASEALESSDVQSASANIEAYLESNCGA